MDFEMSEIYIVEKELSYVIMKSAFEVHNALGPGFPEAIYEEAMNRELVRNGVSLERQKRIKVLYFESDRTRVGDCYKLWCGTCAVQPCRLQ